MILKLKYTVLMVGTCLLVNASAADAPHNWKKDCAKCHGPEGKGDTRIGRRFQIRDFTDSKVQASFTDEEAVKAIKEGVVVHGKKRMKGYEKKFTDAEIQALVDFVRCFKQGQ